jgi:hypothetical protein
MTAAQPLAALSPDPDQLVLFFVDDQGNLNGVAARYDAGDVPKWGGGTVVATGAPSNAWVTAVRGFRDLGTGPTERWYSYTVFWVGVDGFVRSAAGHFLDGCVSVDTPVTSISNRIAAPGAALAAVQRVPGLDEVFVVGQNAVWLLTNAGGAWSMQCLDPQREYFPRHARGQGDGDFVGRLEVFRAPVNRGSVERGNRYHFGLGGKRIRYVMAAGGAVLVDDAASAGLSRGRLLQLQHVSRAKRRLLRG